MDSSDRSACLILTFFSLLILDQIIAQEICKASKMQLCYSQGKGSLLIFQMSVLQVYETSFLCIQHLYLLLRINYLLTLPGNY